MRERDLETATQIFAQIKELEKCTVDHDAFGKHLRIMFEFPGATTTGNDWMDVATGLALNPDALYVRTNILIRTMLNEKMATLKTELRKLGIRIETDEPPELKKKKQPLRLVGPQPPPEKTTSRSS